jgi:DNA-directed RNA polymerase specialized sigma24 family protein
MPSQDPGSITWWTGQLKEGDLEAAEPLWKCYFDQLVRLAHSKLPSNLRAGDAGDEEDAALSAFDSFCQGAAAGRYPKLKHRQDVWRLLVAITARKVADQIRHARRLKRGGGRVLDEAALEGADPDHRRWGLDQLPGNDPAPDFVALVAEQHERLLDILGNETLRSVAVWKLDGHTNREIARKLGCCERTVAYKLKLIRLIWKTAR